MVRYRNAVQGFFASAARLGPDPKSNRLLSLLSLFLARYPRLTAYRGPELSTSYGSLSINCIQSGVEKVSFEIDTLLQYSHPLVPIRLDKTYRISFRNFNISHAYSKATTISVRDSFAKSSPPNTTADLTAGLNLIREHMCSQLR